MRTTRWEFPSYSFYDLSGMEQHLEKMAERGWFLDRITNMRWIYRRDTPKTMHYTVSYYAKASAFEPCPSEGEETFHDFCAHAGWNLAASNAKLQVFYNEQESPVPIHTDPETELECIEKVAKQNIAAYILLAILCGIQFLLLCHGFFYDPIAQLADTLTIFTSTAVGLLSFYFIWDLCHYFLWHKRAKLAAEQGEFLVGRSYAGIGRIILYISVLLIAVGFLSIRQPWLQLLILMMILCLGLLGLIVNGVRIGLKKKQVSTNKNRIITLVVDFVLAFALFLGMIFVVSPLVIHDSHLFDSAVPVKMPVTIEMLTETDTSEQKTDYIFKASPFITYSRYHQHTYFGDAGEPVPLFLSCTVIDVHMPFLEEFCRDSLLHDYDDLGDFRENYEETNPFYVYHSIDASLWEADEAWQLYAYGEADDTYLLRSGSRFVVLEPSWLLAPEQIAICADQLNFALYDD